MIRPMSPLEILASDVEDAMEAILKRFKPGMRATIMVWDPTDDERDFALVSPGACPCEVLSAAERLCKRAEEQDAAASKAAPAEPVKH